MLEKKLKIGRLSAMYLMYYLIDRGFRFDKPVQRIVDNAEQGDWLFNYGGVDFYFDEPRRW